MGTILIIVVLILLLGGGGGYYGYNRYGGSGLGGALGLVLIVLLVIWLLGGVQFNHLLGPKPAPCGGPLIGGSLLAHHFGILTCIPRR